MIHFSYIRYKNILSTGNVFTEIQLDRSPSTVIVGENGAGKSTVLDALCYVLFNKPFRNIKKTQLLNTVNNGGMEVQIEFTIGNTEYKIVRGMKPAVFEIYKNGAMLDQPGAIKDYQAQLEDTILKLNYKSFTQIVVLGNASFTPFMQLSTRDRREVIEDLLDIQIFSNMNTLLRERISTNKAELVELHYQIDITEEKIAVQNKYLERLQQDIESQVAEYQKEIEDIRTKHKLSDSIIDSLKDELSALWLGVTGEDKINKKSTKVSGLIQKLHDKSHTCSRKVDFFESNDHCPTCSQDIEFDIRTAKIADLQSDIDVTTDAIAQLKEEQDKLETELTRMSEVHHSINVVSEKIQTIMNDQINGDNSIVRIEKYISDTRMKVVKDDGTHDAIEELEGVLVASRNDQETLTIEKDLYSHASSMLKDGGIKTKIIRQYVPIINKLVNKYLATMDFFVNFELDDEFNETIKSRFRDDFTYASFSEGEKSRIDIALMLTWRAVAKLKNSVNTNLLILDEVFDSSLDSNGVEILMNLFAELHDTNIYVISHKGDILIDKFRSMIKFEKVKQFSRIAA